MDTPLLSPLQRIQELKQEIEELKPEYLRICNSLL